MDGKLKIVWLEQLTSDKWARRTKCTKSERGLGGGDNNAKQKQGQKMRFCIVIHCVGCLNGMLSICILFEIRDFVKHQIKQLTRHSSACTEHCEHHSTVSAWELQQNNSITMFISNEMRKEKTFPNWSDDDDEKSLPKGQRKYKKKKNIFFRE